MVKKSSPEESQTKKKNISVKMKLNISLYFLSLIFNIFCNKIILFTISQWLMDFHPYAFCWSKEKKAGIYEF